MADLRSAIADILRGGGKRDVSCPAHDDQRRSLSVGPGTDGRVLVCCHAGCATDAVLAAAGLTWADVMPERDTGAPGEIIATYDHCDESGTPVFQSVRYSPKGFRLRRPDGAGAWLWDLDGVRRIPYALERLTDVPDLWIVEGHKDTESLWHIGLPATTSPQGASDWRDSYAEDLIRVADVERVSIVPDHDKAGWQYARRVAASFHARGVTVRIVTLPGIHDGGPPAAKHGRDVSDWLAAGHSADQLRAHAEAAAVWTGNATARDAETPAADDAELTARERRIATEMEKERARREARRRLDAEARGLITPPEILTLRERLERPHETTPWRAVGWQPRDSRVLVVAQAKVGKTTLVSNYMRCLVDGDLWLGQHRVIPVAGTVALLDFEMSPGQLDDWLRAQRICNDDRVLLISMRGQGGAFNILDERVRAEWAAQLRRHGVAYVILDCLRPVLDQLGLDEHCDAGQFLVAFDALLREAGISEALIVHHMGHVAERARGDSRLRDWPDCEWRIMRQDDDPASPRFIGAHGRDVNIAESQLTYDPETRALTIVGGSRRDAKSRETLAAVLAVLDASDEALSGRAIKTALRDSDHGKHTIDATLRFSARNGDLAVEAGPHKSKLYRRPASQCPAVSRDCSEDSSPECPAAPIERDTGTPTSDHSQAVKGRDTGQPSDDGPRRRQKDSRVRKGRESPSEARPERDKTGKVGQGADDEEVLSI